MKQSTDYPTRTEIFEGQSVQVYEIEGQNYLTGEDLGRILGLAEPRKGANQIFNRNIEELRLYTIILKMKTQGDTQKRQVRLYSEVGAHIFAMFARTPKAEEVRLWLATLPKRAREMKAAVRERWEDAYEEAYLEGMTRGMALIKGLALSKLGMARGLRLIEVRLAGLTQKEAGKLLDLNGDQVKWYERQWRRAGLSIPAVNRKEQRHQTLEWIEKALKEGSKRGKVLQLIR